MATTKITYRDRCREFHGIDAVSADFSFGVGIGAALATWIVTTPIRVFGHGIGELVHDCCEAGSAISAARKASKEAKAAQSAAAQAEEA